MFLKLDIIFLSEQMVAAQVQNMIVILEIA